MEFDLIMNIFYFLLLSTFWGGSFIAIGQVVDQLPPFFGALLRVAFALVFLILLFSLMGKKIIAPIRFVWMSWISGLFSIGIPFSLLFWGEQFIEPGLAAILNALVPIFTFVIAVSFTRHDEPFTWNKFAGVLLAFIGTLIIFYPKINLPGHTQELLGSLAVFCMSIAYAIGVILNRHIAKKTSLSFHVNLVQQHVSSVVYLGIISYLFEPTPTLNNLMHLTIIIPVLYLAVFSTAIAFIIFFHLIKLWGSVKASMVTYVSPLMAIWLDYIFNHNIPNDFEIIGAVSILIGILLTQNILKQFIPTKHQLE